MGGLSDGFSQREVLTVSELNRRARMVVEKQFPLIWVEGEISNRARPASGHLYLSLKDKNAQVRCALFRARSVLLDFEPANGMQVIARAHASLYEGRGEFQLIVEHLSDAGAGALQRAFDLLKKRLHAEGLFDPEHKKAAPLWPQRIGVITSPTGAVIRDILHILKRRLAAIPVLIYPVPVQGREAPIAMMRALEQANQDQSCDVLVLARGGGSLEDLWAFNDERLARTIYGSRIPVVSAVGHEIDFTIADFVADIRAPTPSAAAELLSPDGSEILRHTHRITQHLERAIRQHFSSRRHKLQWLTARLASPGRRVQEMSQTLDNLSLRMRQAALTQIQRLQARLQQLGQGLERHHPRQRLLTLSLGLEHLAQRLLPAWRQRAERHQARLAQLERALHAVSPLNTLQRGYAIVIREEDGGILRSAAGTHPGDRVRAKLAKGELFCHVEKIDEASG